MRISFTHIFDLTHKAVSIVGAFALTAIGADLLSPVNDLLKPYLPSWLLVILTLAYFIFGIGLSAFLLEKTIFPYWLSTYLYVRLFLGVGLSRSEAERVGFLFDGSLGGTWYPLSTMRKVNKEFRKEALFRFANKICDENGWIHPFAMPEDRLNQRKARQQAENQSNQTKAPPPKPSIDTQVQVALEILGLNQRPDSFEVVKKAYRRKMSEFHPDKFAGERPEVVRYAEEASKRLNVAYAFLEENYGGV